MRLFEDEADYLAFIRVLGEGLRRHPEARLISYCLMPNHWHLVFWPKRGSDRVLSELMQWLGTTHACRWHTHRHTIGTGPIYQGRFKSFPIERDEHLLAVCRYVERNALRANLVEKAELWRWGSLWLRGQAAGLTEEEAALRACLCDWPMDRPVQWRAMVNRPQSQKELEAVRHSVQKGRPYGSAAWVARTADRLDLSSTLRGRGRPKKAV